MVELFTSVEFAEFCDSVSGRAHRRFPLSKRRQEFAFDVSTVEVKLAVWCR